MRYTYKRPCAYCQKPFTSKSHSARYCSYRCSKDMSIKMQERAREKRLSVEIICKHCEKAFPKRRENRRFCSLACKQQAYRKRKIVMKETSTTYKGEV